MFRCYHFFNEQKNAFVIIEVEYALENEYNLNKQRVTLMYYKMW